jgi:hypothetical protein
VFAEAYQTLETSNGLDYAIRPAWPESFCSISATLA